MFMVNLGSANLLLMQGLSVSYQQHLFIKLLEANYNRVALSGHGSFLGVGKYRYYLQENIEYFFSPSILLDMGLSPFEFKEFYEGLISIKFIDNYTDGPESSVNTTALYRFYLNLEDKGLADNYIEPLIEISGGYISYNNQYSEQPYVCDKSKKATKKNGNIYLMGNKRNGYTKIGFTTKDPKYRESTLQSEEPEVELVKSFKGTMDDEQRLHEEFHDKRLRGEWFDLDDSDLIAIDEYFQASI